MSSLARLFSPESPIHPEKAPVIQQWQSLTQRPLELLAGQHRLEALREFLQTFPDSICEGAKWWICDVYDQGRRQLPLSLCQTRMRTDG
jgi:hypothetical protein